MNKLLLKKLLPYILVFIGVAYGFWPLDAIPDIPIIGWLDDAGILGTAIIIAYKLWSKKENKEST